MGISSNQARFLALTSRQIDLEHRIQQICQRRLRLTSELENVATSYNNKISNRQLYSMNTSNSGISTLSVDGINSLLDSNGNNYKLLAPTVGDSKVVIGMTDARIATMISTGSVTLSDGATVITLAQLGLDSSAKPEEVIDQGIRQGVFQIGALPDEFTQSYSTGYATTEQFEIKDWRTLPVFADELYNGDDVDAENKYDKTVNEINAQDKKLQLEQTTIEVEYKAITSEKESVKKILDTNAQASFKYFS